MGRIRIGGEAIKYTIRKNSNSKYLVLSLKDDRVLEISLPKHARIDVKKILKRKRSWIIQKFEELSERKKVIEDKKILYRGQAYSLDIVYGKKCGVSVLNGRIVVKVNGKKTAGEVLRKWMAQKSEKFAKRKATKFAVSLGISSGFKIETRDMKSWGKCVDKKRLIFNWRLVGLPTRLAEYVVAHETVHLIENKHSKRFKRKITTICPQYKELRSELKRYLL